MQTYVIGTPLGKMEVECEAIELHDGALVVLDNQDPPQVIITLADRAWTAFRRKDAVVSWSRGY